MKKNFKISYQNQATTQLFGNEDDFEKQIQANLLSNDRSIEIKKF